MPAERPPQVESPAIESRPIESRALQARALVVGCGNRTRGDDAIGPLVIEALNRRREPAISAVDLGVRPDRLIDCLSSRRWARLILVDAVAAPGLAPGRVIELDGPAVQALSDRPTGTHGFSLIAQVRFAERLGLLPRDVELIGLTLGAAGVETAPDPALARRVDELADRIIARARARSAAPMAPTAPTPS